MELQNIFGGSYYGAKLLCNRTTNQRNPQTQPAITSDAFRADRQVSNLCQLHRKRQQEHESGTFVQIANALEIPADLLLMEQVKGSPLVASQEITMILTDCSTYERFIIIDTVKTLKEALRAHKDIMKRNNR